MSLVSSHKSLLSHWTSQQTNILIVQQRGTPKYIWKKNHNSSIIPRLILLIETYIQTCNHSYTVHLFKSTDTILFTSLDTFSSTSWTLSFSSWTLSFSSWTLSFSSWTLFLFLFLSLSLWGPLIYLLSSIRGSPPHRLNWVDFRTRLPGCASHQVCSTYVSTPQGQPSGPGPGCYL